MIVLVNLILGVVRSCFGSVWPAEQPSVIKNALHLHEAESLLRRWQSLSWSKDTPNLCGTRRFFDLFTTTGHLTLSWRMWTQFTSTSSSSSDHDVRPINILFLSHDYILVVSLTAILSRLPAFCVLFVCLISSTPLTYLRPYLFHLHFSIILPSTPRSLPFGLTQTQ
jgi:hypothetical protein